MGNEVIEGNSHGDVGSIYHATGGHSFVEKEYLFVASKVGEALMHAVIRDPIEQNRCTEYLALLEEFGLTKKMEIFIHWLTMSRAVGGQQWNEFGMALAHVWVPEGGRKMSNKQVSEYMKVLATRASVPTENQKTPGNNHQEVE